MSELIVQIDDEKKEIKEKMDTVPNASLRHGEDLGIKPESPELPNYSSIVEEIKRSRGQE
jgi:hypothetical protein